MRVRLAGMVLALGMALVPVTAARSDRGVWIAVVVQAGVEDPIDGRALSLIFRRKQLYAQDGERWQPVNLPADHPLRRQFSRAVLGASPEALEDFWNQQYFQGLLPPHVVGSEEAVRRFVASTPYGIGYVDACQGEPDLRTVLLIDPNGGWIDARQGADCAAR